MPQFTSENRANAGLFEDLHIYLAYVLIAMVVLHIAAALYHHFVKRDHVLARMVSGEPGV